MSILLLLTIFMLMIMALTLNWRSCPRQKSYLSCLTIFSHITETLYFLIYPSQNSWLMMSLSLVLLICSSKESCFSFVDAGGMEQIINLLCSKTPRTAATTLLLLSIVENATRHGVGCEAFLGWWPRCDHSSAPTCCSSCYCSLLKLLMEKERHDIASLTTYMLQRLRFYEILSRYESAVVKVVSDLPSDELSTDGVSLLIFASSELAEMLKLINMCGPFEYPLPVTVARKISKSVNMEDSLSFKATIDLITSSKYSFLQFHTDSYLLSLIQGDLFPDEGIWLWTIEVPSLIAIRSLSIGMVLGPQVEKQVNWYLHPEHVALSINSIKLKPTNCSKFCKLHMQPVHVSVHVSIP